VPWVERLEEGAEVGVLVEHQSLPTSATGSSRIRTPKPRRCSVTAWRVPGEHPRGFSTRPGQDPPWLADAAAKPRVLGPSAQFQPPVQPTRWVR
jgi:hypothetical protein